VVPQEYLLLLASRCPGTAKACSLSLDQLKNTVAYPELLQFAFKQRRPPYTWKTQHMEQKENGRRGLLPATWNSTCKLQGLHSRTQLANVHKQYPLKFLSTVQSYLPERNLKPSINLQNGLT